MARDVNRRLSSLKSRRSGGLLTPLAKALFEESYVHRARGPNTRYALGAMTAVDEDYTRISIETAERIGNQLKSGLDAAGKSVDFRLQGSVPLNVHIRGVSDVDLLTLDTSHLVYDTAGALASANYYIATTNTSVGVLSALRRDAARILAAKFPAAKVDETGSKAIKVSGGSLPRNVDVVPSHWWDTVAYQASRQELSRGVIILDNRRAETIKNLPFLHIGRISNQDMVCGGGLRKAIRLCKNVKSDAEEEGTAVSLPSFDIAATMYHADAAALQRSTVFELAALAETQRHLDALATNHAEASKLMVPDGSRVVFDTKEKFAGLVALSYEIDDLLKQVAMEHVGVPSGGSAPTLSQCRLIVSAIRLPAT